MTLTKEFYSKLRSLENAEGSLKNYSKDSDEIKELRLLATGKADPDPEQETELYKRKADPVPGDRLLPWRFIDTDAIYQLRKEKNIPLYQMAELLNMSTSQYNRIEKNLVQMKNSQFELLVRIFNVKKADLLLKNRERQA